MFNFGASRQGVQVREQSGAFGPEANRGASRRIGSQLEQLLAQGAGGAGPAAPGAPAGQSAGGVGGIGAGDGGGNGVPAQRSIGVQGGFGPAGPSAGFPAGGGAPAPGGQGFQSGGGGPAKDPNAPPGDLRLEGVASGGPEAGQNLLLDRLTNEANARSALSGVGPATGQDIAQAIAPQLAAQEAQRADLSFGREGLGLQRELGQLGSQTQLGLGQLGAETTQRGQTLEGLQELLRQASPQVVAGQRGSGFGFGVGSS